MNDPDWDMVSRAIVVYTGMDRLRFPHNDEAAVVAQFGAAAAAQLMPLVLRLEDDFYASDAAKAANSLSEMGDVASAEFKAKHPEISDAAVKALRWSYTFNNR